MSVDAEQENCLVKKMFTIAQVVAQGMCVELWSHGGGFGRPGPGEIVAWEKLMFFENVKCPTKVENRIFGRILLQLGSENAAFLSPRT